MPFMLITENNTGPDMVQWIRDFSAWWRGQKYKHNRRWFSPFLQSTKALRESRGIAVLCFLDLGTRRGEGSASRPGHFLSPGKTRYPLYTRLGEPQGRSGQVQKISPPPAFDPRTIQPVASLYTDWSTRPTKHSSNIYLLILISLYVVLD
jgi:hypothetical protein